VNTMCLIAVEKTAQLNVFNNAVFSILDEFSLQTAQIARNLSTEHPL